jgi:hypothetical protein
MKYFALILILQYMILIYCQETYVLHSNNQNCDKPTFGLIYSGCSSLGNFSSISATCQDDSRYVVKTCPRLECTSPCRSSTIDGKCNFEEGVYKKMQCGGSIKGGIVQSYSDPFCTKPDAPRGVYLTESCTITANSTSFQYSCRDSTTLIMHEYENTDCFGDPRNTRTLLQDSCEFFGNNFSRLLTCGTYEGDMKKRLEVKKEDKEPEADKNFLKFNFGLASLFLLLLCNIL